MATITIPIDESLPTTSEALSQGDDRIREIRQATRERAENAGQYWPNASTDARCGVPYTSPNAIRTNEWNVFDKDSGGGPSTTGPLVRRITVNAGGNVQLRAPTDTVIADVASTGVAVTGTLSSTGNLSVPQKRVIVLSATANYFGTAGDGPTIQDAIIYMPLAYSGTLKEAVFLRATNLANISFELRLLAASNWVNDALTVDPIGTAGVVISAATPSPVGLGTANYGIRWKDAADFSGGTFPTLAGGDILYLKQLTATGSSFGHFSIIVELNW